MTDKLNDIAPQGDTSCTYDAWGRVLSTTGSACIMHHNPLRYRGYVYDTETGLYYLKSRYYDPAKGRFISPDSYISTGQGILGHNMFAYCLNNSANFQDPAGSRMVPATIISSGGKSRYAPNTEYLMAFHGVDVPEKLPEMPENAMIFVENITSVSNRFGMSIIEGRTIVMDADKYCEYTFVGIGWSYSYSIPLDRTVSQGYVYGLEDVTDYTGIFFGGATNMLSTIHGGAVASPKVYAEILGGMSYAASIGGSITYYITGQSDWIYGRANMVIVTNPYQKPLLGKTTI